MSADRPLVRLEGVVKRYQEGGVTRTVLDGLDFEIGRGELVVLLGRSGAGKSTLLNCISGIDRADEGAVWIGDTDLARLSETERTLFRRKHLGFVFQAFNLIPTLTVEENVLLPLELAGQTDRAARERAQMLLREVGLGDRGDSFPDLLSGGEQQRVAIARALAHQPLLLLADEPTGNLDVHTAEQVLGLLDRLVRQAGETLLVVTHDRDLIKLADRVVRMHEGRLEEVEG